MKILVSKRANEDFSRILEYLEYRWGASSVEKFKSITNDFFDILESFPEIGSLELPAKSIRGFPTNQANQNFLHRQNQAYSDFSIFRCETAPRKKEYLIVSRFVTLTPHLGVVLILLTGWD